MPRYPNWRRPWPSSPAIQIPPARRRSPLPAGPCTGSTFRSGAKLRRPVQSACRHRPGELISLPPCPSPVRTARLKAPPLDGKAKEELITLIASHFGCPTSAVSIKSGASSRLKLVRIDAHPESAATKPNKERREKGSANRPHGDGLNTGRGRPPASSRLSLGNDATRNCWLSGLLFQQEKRILESRCTYPH